jgi:hypothetical protein
LHAGEDFAELVGVDAKAVEGVGLGELGVGFGLEEGRVALAGVLACREMGQSAYSEMQRGKDWVSAV